VECALTILTGAERDSPVPGADRDEAHGRQSQYAQRQNGEGRSEIRTVIAETTHISSTLSGTLYSYRIVRRWAASPSTAALATGTLNAYMRKNEYSDRTTTDDDRGEWIGVTHGRD
jgi:hypothetical protein